MKRVFALLLLALLLCGCAEQATEETSLTTENTLPSVEPTEPTGSYDADSELELSTGGAVRTYSPDIGDAYAVAAMGQDLVVFSGTETTTLTKLTGENLYITAACTLDIRIDPEEPAVQVTEKGVSYYDSAACELVLLGTGLKEINRVSLPQELVGQPVISADRKQVYYCTAQYAWALDMETGIHRRIKEISEAFTSAQALLWSGTVLQCGLEGEKQIFLSVENGKTLWQGTDQISAATAGESWYAVVPEGLIDAYVFSTAGSDARMLLLEAFDAKGWYLEDMNCLVGLIPEEGGTRLDCYDLTAGTCCSRLTITEEIRYLAKDAVRGTICVLTGEGNLYRWDISAMPGEDARVYTTPRYTLENPDEEGYARCAAYAEEIGSRHGVEILFGEMAVAVQSRDYDLTGEYMIPVLLSELEKLDTLLSVYPEGMLESAVADTTGGTLHICLVREITGSPESGIPDSVGGTQFWEGSDAYVILAVGQEDGGALYHQMYHALENRLMSNSMACYDWEYLNPEGFDYDYNYILNLSREDGGYLEGENRYFIDTYSMSFPKEDRARIMEYAMMEGNEAFFESDAMQAKLKALCVGFREAYGMKKSPDTFLWEQYLKESLAYTK